MITDYTTFARYASATNAYVLVNYTTGEVRCMSCELAHIALRDLYRIYDRELRSARKNAYDIHMVLANVRTGRVVAEIDRHFEYEKLIEEVYESLEG